MKTRYLSYWLIPTTEDSVVLQAVIDELATRFGTHSFPPHLTIFAGPISSGVEPIHLLDSLSPDLVPKHLEVTRMDTSNRFTMTLFLRFPKNPKLVSLQEKIQANSAPSNYSLDPHLSLLYADFLLSTKESLADEFNSLLKKIRFDRIRAVSHPSPVQTQEDIKDFRNICEVVYRPNQ
jgi:hypothetical protein